MTETNNHIFKLPNAPLQEVIFELRWKLDFDQETQSLLDKEFQFAFANFVNLSSHKLKHKINLRPAIISESMFANKPVYQFWAEKGIYPVFQIGPGVFTVNETDKNYVWDSFKELIREGIDWLSKSYSNKLEFTFAELRYIDAIEILEDNQINLSKFIADNLSLEIKNKVIDARLNDIQFHQRFKLDSENFLSLLIANGVKNNSQVKAIILQISYNKTSNISLETLSTWIESAHTTCSELFRRMVSTKLYEQFTKTI